MSEWAAIYAIGYVVSVAVSIGWNFAHFQGKYQLITEEDWRTDMGFAILWSVVGMALWPFMLPALYCMTGFAQYGWRVR